MKATLICIWELLIWISGELIYICHLWKLELHTEWMSADLVFSMCILCAQLILMYTSSWFCALSIRSSICLFSWNIIREFLLVSRVFISEAFLFYCVIFATIFICLKLLSFINYFVCLFELRVLRKHKFTVGAIDQSQIIGSPNFKVTTTAGDHMKSSVWLIGNIVMNKKLYYLLQWHSIPGLFDVMMQNYFVIFPILHKASKKDVFDAAKIVANYMATVPNLSSIKIGHSNYCDLRRQKPKLKCLLIVIAKVEQSVHPNAKLALIL